MTGPEISVIVAAYNAMPYLSRCLDSVGEQTLEPARLEVIVVDDGSTDDTAGHLTERTADRPGWRVIRREHNSGGPAVPRNDGLDVARGEYVFFLDADDYLGPEALARMLAMARKNDSDIVLGKMVGIGGRAVPRSMFTRDQPRTTVWDSRVFWALNPLKLFRREFIERHGLRFPVDLPVGQDQPFVARAYVHAKVVSVLASYDCYFARLRDDGGNNTQREGGAVRRLPLLNAMFSLLPEIVEPGERRDLLLRRVLQSDQREFLEHLGRENDPALRHHAFDVFRNHVSRFATPSVVSPLPASDRLRLELVRRGDLAGAVEMMRFQKDGEPWNVRVDDGRAYAEYPGFETDLPRHLFDVTDELSVVHRLTAAAWGDAGFHITGEARIPGLPVSSLTAQVVLVTRDGSTAYPVPTRCVPVEDRIRFETALDFTDLGGTLITPDRWDVFVDLDWSGVHRRVRIGARRDADVMTGESTRLVGDGIDVRTVTAYLTKPFGNLSFDVDMRRGRRPLPVTVALTTRGGAFRGTGTVPAIGLPQDAIRWSLRTPAGDRVPLPGGSSGTGHFDCALPARRLVTNGRLECTIRGLTGTDPTPVLAGGEPPRLRAWWPSPRTWRIRRHGTQVRVDNAPITPVKIMRRLRRRLAGTFGR
ncbi:CDP-glycerol glycerophosphotransferase [Stackebrandtia albiflava]|uniref:CDP-glycerol glycerophosphotransferase n=1 Tax=Stackebrandtia albiflava TaxID=406432 RepID=A0A562V330_9ACTN|nr:glycosyltransferase [Stackebrandtia albiflava]TWJ12300.1 CDP-glycerol glycerophosphotransferase [Stackebrandtia albiflava]